MKGYIYSHKTLIGTTEFVHSFGSMGHIWGEFIPTNEYLLVKTQVQEFNTSKKADYKRWHSLRFNIQLENGYFLLPVGGYNFDDLPELSDEEPFHIHAAGIHSHAYFDFFENNLPFVIAPWQRLNIEQKIDLEDALFHTIGETNVNFSALAKNGSNGDALFAIHGDNVPPFVIANIGSVHTTIAEIFPEENYFWDFESVRRRMATSIPQ